MKLYHYTSSDSVIKILASEKIKFTLIEELNDPFEFQFDADPADHEQFDKILREQAAVFCCSKNPNKILMLSHYANKHKGWFIEFEFNKNPSNKNIGAAHVEYDKPIPDLRKLFTEIDRAKSLEENLEKLKKDVERFTFEVVARKHSSWHYEEETRLLLSKVGDKLYYDDLFLTLQECGLEIKAVYEGCRVSKQDREIVEKIIKTKNQHIEMKKAISNDSYKTDNRVF